MQIDPKWMFYLGLVASILGALTNGVGQLKFLPANYAADLAQINALLLNVATALMTFLAGFSSNKSGPLVPPAVPKVCIALLAGVFLFLGVGEAQAQKLPRLPDLGNIARQNDANPLGGRPGAGAGEKLPTPDQLWQKITTASLDDLAYAAALATSANTNGSKVRLTCINALIDINKQARGDNLPKNADGTPMAKPDPSLVTHMEMTAEVIDALSPTGPLFTACAGAAGLLRMQVLQVINAIVTGAAGAAVAGPLVGLP